MVEVAKVGFLSDIRNQDSYEKFPVNEAEKIRKAVEKAPSNIFIDSKGGNEIKKFDEYIANELSNYEFEHSGESGRNPKTKLWRNNGFNHSVDLYNKDKRIAVEIEKSERKRVSDDFLKFIKGAKTRDNKRNKIIHGCVIVPVNYRGSGNIFSHSMNELEFMRSIMFVDDICVIGYIDPRWS